MKKQQLHDLKSRAHQAQHLAGRMSVHVSNCLGDDALTDEDLATMLARLSHLEYEVRLMRALLET